jgi:hypothetical protein
VPSLLSESELELEHALNSVALVHEVRKVLAPEPKAATEFPKQAASLVSQIDEILEHTPAAHVPLEWRVMVAGLQVLASQVACLTIAKVGKGDLLTERARCDVLISELRRVLSSDSLSLPDTANSIRQSLLRSGESNANELHKFLSLIPLPILYWFSRDLEIPYRAAIEKPNSVPSPLLRVVIFLDNSPIVSPQLLKPNILYPLVFRLRGVTWPGDVTRLRLDLLTTCPQSEFSVSEFSIDSPHSSQNGEYEGELPGYIKFNSAQSTFLDDLVFKIRGAFERSDGGFLEVPVIGHNELRLRVVSQDRHPLMTGNRLLDRHIEELVTTLLLDCPIIRGEMPELLDMLQALSRLLATYAQEAIYKERSDVLEPEFHSTVLRDLRLMLGQDVQEHPNQAGGIPDIRFRGVIVELKVERHNGDRAHISKKYASQSAQYAGVEARQVSIILVLDLTSKDKPPSDIRNDIILTGVPTHGGDDRTKAFPSSTFVFVINGNMKSPSTYSR